MVCAVCCCCYGPVPVIVMSKLKFVIPVAVGETDRVRMAETTVAARSEYFSRFQVKVMLPAAEAGFQLPTVMFNTRAALPLFFM